VVVAYVVAILPNVLLESVGSHALERDWALTTHLVLQRRVRLRSMAKLDVGVVPEVTVLQIETTEPADPGTSNPR
jgi:hypothetical protein